jgi:hypothetical protein
LNSLHKKITAHGHIGITPVPTEDVDVGIIFGFMGTEVTKTCSLVIPVKGARAEVRGTSKVVVAMLAADGEDRTSVTLTADSSTEVDVRFTLHVNGPRKIITGVGSLMIKDPNPPKRTRSGDSGSPKSVRNAAGRTKGGIGDWGAAKSIGLEAKPTEVIEIGVIEDRATKSFKLPVGLRDANVEIEGTDKVKVLKIAESSDGFLRVTVAVDARTAIEDAFVLIVDTPDKILRCEGRVSNSKPVELFELAPEKDQSTMTFRLPISADGSTARIRGTDKLKVTQIEDAGSGWALVTVCCDPAGPLHSAFKLVVESAEKIVTGEGRVDFTPVPGAEAGHRRHRAPVESIDLPTRRGKVRTTYKLSTGGKDPIATSVSGPIGTPDAVLRPAASASGEY